MKETKKNGYKYHDIETQEILTEEELRDEYEEQKWFGWIDSNMTFEEYINNCLTRNNGTLEIIYD